jgi:2-iminobutanoate/2-iminopropanoate deaminase
MIERINPPTVVQPASKYAQAVVHSAAARRIVISGQIGVAPDGKLAVGLEAQARQTWENIFAVLAHTGFERHHLVKVTTFCTVKGQVAATRHMRDDALAGLLVASTYIEVAGLAAPEYLIEIEAEAVMA